MKIILFTNARDEKHIKEWVAHHLNLGFDFIHIFDHKSIEPISNQFKPNPKLIIKRIDYNAENLKESLMMKAKEYSVKNDYDWMLYLDADEFLILNDCNNIHELLVNYKRFNQIGINWVFFGSSYLSKEPEGMILENYIRCSSTIDKHIKAFVRPETVLSTSTPHVFTIKNMSLSVNSYTMNKLNGENPFWYPLPGKSYCDIPVYIAHYNFQAYDVYISRKINLPRDDINAYRTCKKEEFIHSLNNDIINTTVRDKYSEKNAELMKVL